MVVEKGSQLWNWIWSSRGLHEQGLRRWAWVVARIVAIVAIEFRKDAIQLRASALTYTIVFSMVPFLALGTAVLKGMGAGDQMKTMAYTFIESMEAAAPAANATAGTPATKGASLVAHLKRAADMVFAYVDKTNFATLGIFGTIGMLVTVISLLGNIEESMNHIWRASRGRPLGRRIMDYLALMILLPISVNIGLAAMAALQNRRLVAWLSAVIPAGWTIPLLIHGFTLVVIVATFVTLYRFLPNTRVPFFPAFVGGVVGGTGWLLLQAVYIKLQVGVARYNAIYGSFATLPLFLLWIYLGWMVFLTGAEFSFATCVWRRYNPSWDRLTPARRFALAMDIILALYGRFKERAVSTVADLARRVEAPEAPVLAVLDDLARAKLVRFDTTGADEVLPSTDPREVTAAEVFRAVVGHYRGESAGARIAGEALDAAEERLRSLTVDEALSR